MTRSHKRKGIQWSEVSCSLVLAALASACAGETADNRFDTEAMGQKLGSEMAIAGTGGGSAQDPAVLVGFGGGGGTGSLGFKAPPSDVTNVAIGLEPA